jgi:hypothetical protein
MYFSKKEASTQKKYVDLETKFKDSTLVMYNNLVDADYFSLEQNDFAQDYLINYNISELIPKVKDALMEYNTQPNGNPYIDQPPMNDKKFIVNKIKLLNHRWLIANYSNGEIWGELIAKYFVNENGTITFQTMESIIYPKQVVQQ